MEIDQDLLNDIKKELIRSDEDVTEQYYGIQISVYKNIDKYLARIPSIYDKILLAQWANNYTKANELISSVEMDENSKNKYNRLLQNNIDLNETIDLRLLTSKYDFLDDMLDMITTQKDVQEQILSLSEEKLEIFKKLYNHLKDNLEYRVTSITSILNRMGTITPYTSWQNSYYKYNELTESISESIKKGDNLSSDEINNLLYLFTSNIVWEVNTKEELGNFTNSNGIFSVSINDIIEKEEKDINNIKNSLLLKTFGIDLTSARYIYQRYDLNSLKVNEDNIDLFEMYRAIVSILLEENPNVLLETYRDFSKEMHPQPNFMRTVVFENALRKEFAKSLTSSVYKCDSDYYIQDGVKVFDLENDFKMIVTAVGAYQTDFNVGDNYKDYWNSPTIRSHGNCCSLIGNNNLSMANPKNVIFGFSSMDDNMLLLSSSRDINSTPLSKRFNIAQEEGNSTNRTIDGKIINSISIGYGIEFTNPDSILNNTRGDYNELVYERRDLSSNPLFYKKNPDYIVFIEEYENIDDYIKEYEGNEELTEYIIKQKEEQQYKYDQSIKAAKDFNIPLVIVNREKHAKKSADRIEEMIQLFEKNKDGDLIDSIICQFENNRVGNHNKHQIIREKYFSKEKMDGYLTRIESTIKDINDRDLYEQLMNRYYNAIKLEEVKVKKCKHFRKNGQESGIDFDKTIMQIKESNTIDDASVISDQIRR